MDEKDQRLADFCRERGLAGVWIRRRANVAWLSGGADVHVDATSKLGVASILWTPQRKQVLCTNIEAARLRAEELSDAWELVATDWWRAGPPIDEGFASDWPDDVLVDLRAPLTELEVARVQALGSETAEVLRDILFDVERGWSELKVAGEIQGRLRRRAIQTPVVLVAADERIARFRHPIPTGKRCERALMAVVCAERRGLIVALTRLVHFGVVPLDLRLRHDAVCAIDAALHAATKPGARWCDLFALAQRAYAEHGYPDEWKLHHQGGPMGYAARDFLATPDETRTVQERQLVGWNPSITGTKSEDTLLTGAGVVSAMRDWPMLGTRPDILVRR